MFDQLSIIHYTSLFINHQTLYERPIGTSPNYNFYNSLFVPILSNYNHKNKTWTATQLCSFLGYSVEHKTFPSWNPISRCLCFSSQVMFSETTFSFMSSFQIPILNTHFSNRSICQAVFQWFELAYAPNIALEPNSVSVVDLADTPRPLHNSFEGIVPPSNPPSHSAGVRHLLLHYKILIIFLLLSLYVRLVPMRG